MVQARVQGDIAVNRTTRTRRTLRFTGVTRVVGRITTVEVVTEFAVPWTESAAIH